MHSKLYFILLLTSLCLLSPQVYAQIGGQRSFEFLSLPANALPAAIGGVTVTALSGGAEVSLSNPALLNESITGKLSFTHLNYFADINYNSFSFAHKFKKPGLLSLNIQFWDYGTFEGYDQTGASTGEFEARDFAVTLGHSRQVDNFTLGANLKFASSGISSFTSSALLFDFGGVFKHPEIDLTVGLAFKNIGFLLNDFNSSNSRLPFDLQVGASIRPEHMPVRISVTAYNLYQGDIAFFDENIQSQSKKPGVGENIFRHFTFGTEFILSENFNVRAGYNPLIRKELRLNDISGGAGFSFGFMLRIKSFELAYSNARYHAAGGANYISLLVNLNTLLKKTKTTNSLNND